MNKVGVVVLSKYDNYMEAFMTSFMQREPNWRETSQLIVGSDGLSEQCKAKYRDMGVTILDMPAPFNYARNINACVNALDDGIDFLLLNDDVYFLTDNPVTTMARVFDESKYSKPPYAVICLAVASGVVGNQGQYLNFADPHMTIPIAGNIAFVAVGIYRSVWVEVGNMDEEFHGYGFDDDDWCRRAIELNYRMGVTGQVALHHGFGEYNCTSTWQRSNADIDQEAAKNRAIYDKKWPEGRLRRPI